MFKETIIVWLVILNIIYCSPYDNGKYNPRNFRFKDGKYYRPLDEGKYKRGPEGKYTYIYMQGLQGFYRDDSGFYRYMHQEGPNGPDGGFGGFYESVGPNGDDGPNGSGDKEGSEGIGGPNGASGPGGYGEPGGPEGPTEYTTTEEIVELENFNEIHEPKGANSLDEADLSGFENRIYAEQYPHFHSFIFSLADNFVSNNYINHDKSTEENRHKYDQISADNGTALVCRYSWPQYSSTFTVNGSDPYHELGYEDYTGDHFIFKGVKCIAVPCAEKKRKILKLQYEVLVKVVDEFIEDIE